MKWLKARMNDFFKRRNFNKIEHERMIKERDEKINELEIDLKEYEMWLEEYEVWSKETDQLLRKYDKTQNATQVS
jgi:hypothetical protein